MPEHEVRRLKPLCVTRWVESHKTFITFKELLIPVIRTLEVIIEEGGDSVVAANGLLSAICKYESVVCLFVTERFSALFLPLSEQLQSKDLDVFEAREAIDSMFDSLINLRETAENDFKDLFIEATAVCAELDVDVRLPRLCKRLTQRENHSVDNLEEYFRVSVYLPHLDRLIEEFGSMFEDMRENALKLQFLIPE